MSKIRNHLPNACGFVILIGAVVFSSSITARSQAKASNVNVVNTASNPVPTVAQGTTSIAGNVSVTNTPTVNLASGATVGINNDASRPVPIQDVDRPTAQPFKQTSQLTFDPGFALAMGGQFSVPAGKRLVIECVTVIAEVPLGQNVLYARIVNAGNALILTLTHPGNYAAGEVFVGTHRVFAVLEPGTQVQPSAFRDSGTAGGTMSMLISGYLVDVP